MAESLEARVLVNGRLDGRLDPWDPGLLLGHNVFDTWRCYGAQPFRMEEHLARLWASAEAARVPTPPLERLREELAQVSGPDRWVRVTLTVGGQRLVSSKPVDAARIGRPVRVAWHEVLPPRSLPGRVKHGSRAAWLLEAQRAGVDEVLLVTAAGELLESSLSNVFAVLDGVLVTPPDDGRILAGVTRGAMLEAAARAGLPHREGALREVDNYEEIYVSSSLKELAPIVEIAGQPAAGAGPVGAALHAAFRALVDEECGL